MEPLVTTEEFICLLYNKSLRSAAECSGGFLAAALVKGWIEPLDRVLAGEYIERRAAARIIHQFLRLVLKEPDLPDWEPAKQLQDLYDCRSCVDHVAQVYCRGIMHGKFTEDGVFIFGMRDNITWTEAEEIIRRIFKGEKIT